MIKRNHKQTVNCVLLSITTIILAVLGLIIGLFLFIDNPARAARGPVSFPRSGGRIVITPRPGPGQPPIFIPPPTPEELQSMCREQGGGTCLFPNCGPTTSFGGGRIATTGTACVVTVPPGGGIGITGLPPGQTLTPGAPSLTPTPPECPGES